MLTLAFKLVFCRIMGVAVGCSFFRFFDDELVVFCFLPRVRPGVFLGLFELLVMLFCGPQKPS